MKSRNLFWGLFFVAMAVFVIASQTGSFVQISVLGILATVLIAAIVIHSVLRRNFFGVFVPASFLYLIYRQPLALPGISFWLLLLAAVLASVGFSFLFHSRPHGWGCCRHPDMKRFGKYEESGDDNNPSARASFSGSSKYLHGDSIKSGQFSCSFGSLEVFFDEARLSPEGAEIYLDVSFGSIELYVPKQWKVIDDVRVSLGAVENDIRLPRPGENAPRLTLTGSVQFGNVEIHYV